MSARKPLPAPRIQLRWEACTSDPRWQWQCHYELVIPLTKYDIRAEQEGPRGGRRPPLRELVIPVKQPSVRNSTGVPCTAQDGSRYFDDPYRDGAHAQWDAQHLGNPPIYVIAPDGMAFSRAEHEASRAKATPQGAADHGR